MAEQFSAGKPGEITVYLPKGIEIPFKISNGSGNMQIDNISIQELSLVNTSGYVVLSNVTVSNAKIVTTSGDVTFENSTIPDVEIVSKSGYVTLKDVNFDSLAIVTSSGEVGVGGAGVYSALKVQTDSGDVSVSHKESPTDLQLDVTTDSNDITMQLNISVQGATNDIKKCFRYAEWKSQIFHSIFTYSLVALIDEIRPSVAFLLSSKLIFSQSSR